MICYRENFVFSNYSFIIKISYNIYIKFIHRGYLQNVTSIITYLHSASVNFEPSVHLENFPYINIRSVVNT